jgi:hypothetical protein
MTRATDTDTEPSIEPTATTIRLVLEDQRQVRVFPAVDDCGLVISWSLELTYVSKVCIELDFQHRLRRRHTVIAHDDALRQTVAHPPSQFDFEDILRQDRSRRLPATAIDRQMPDPPVGIDGGGGVTAWRRSGEADHVLREDACVVVE